MKNLAEVRGDTLITVKADAGDIEVMSKTDFEFKFVAGNYDQAETLNITMAEELTAEFSFWNMLDYFGEEMHDDWKESVFFEIESSGIDVKKFEQTMHLIFENNPTYYEGEELLINFK